MFSGDTSGSGDESSGPGSPLITGTLNAIDVNGPVTYSIYGSGITTEGGTYSIDSSGVWSYRPKPDFFGQDSFVVVSTDSQGGTSTKQIILVLRNVDDPAIFSGDTSGSGDESSGSGSLPITGTLTATDIDGDPVTYSISSGSGDRPKYGFAKIDGSGVWSYRPNQGVYGQDSFVVVSTDTQGGKSEQKITVNILEGDSAGLPTLAAGEDPIYLIIDYDMYLNYGNGCPEDISVEDFVFAFPGVLPSEVNCVDNGVSSSSSDSTGDGNLDVA
jgi:VCBS repeat-containing protein